MSQRYTHQQYPPNNYLAPPLLFKHFFTDGYYQAREFMRKQPKQASHLMALRLHLTPVETVNAFHGLKLPSLTENKALFAGNPSIFYKSSISVLNILEKSGLIKKQNLDITQLQNSRFIEASRL